MSNEQKTKEELHEIAGGWITERAGTPIPGFLKLAYVGFACFGLTYLFTYWKGETDHATRGALVQQMNASTGEPSGLLLGVIGLAVAAFAGGLWFYAIVRKPTSDD